MKYKTNVTKSVHLQNGIIIQACGMEGRAMPLIEEEEVQ